MAIPFITQLPEAPQRTDARPNFALRADIFFSAIDPMRYQMNQMAAWINQQRDDIYSYSDEVEAIRDETALLRAIAKADADRANDEADRAQLAADKSEEYRDDTAALIAAFTPTGDPLPEVTSVNAPLVVATPQGGVKFSRRALNNGAGVRPALRFDFANQGYLDPRIEFTRASKDWDSQGREYGINEPVLTDEGLWVSGARTNLFLQSSNLTQTPWGSLGSIRKLSGLKSPIGTEVFSVDREGSGINYLYQPVTVEDGIDYTFSCLVQFKTGEEAYRIFMAAVAFDGAGTSYFTLRADGGLDATSGGKYKDLGGGWFLIWRTATGNTNTTGNHIHLHAYPADPLVDNFVSAPQCEEWATPTAYIPTEGSQVTVAESRIGGINVGQAKSFVIDMQRVRNLSDGNTVYFATLSSSPGQHIPSNGVIIWTINSTQILFRVYRSGSTYEDIRVAGNWDTVRKIGFSVSGGFLTVSVDGEVGSVYSAELAEIENSLTYLNISQNLTGQSKYSWIRSVACYDRALTASQLQELTS